MLFSRLVPPGLLPVLLSGGLLAAAAPATRNNLSPDPCAKIADHAFVDPADALACLKSFPFKEGLRQNVISVVSRVFDFYTFEDFYYNSPPPFQESTTNIRGDIERINFTHYETDYDFNMDLYDFTNQLNDGHTRWSPFCYMRFQNVLPAPVVLLDAGVFIAPDSNVLFDQLGPEFANYFKAKGFDWKRLAGAKVLEIGGLPALDYIDQVAHTASGNYLDHNVRVNSVVSSYQMPNGTFSQSLGDLAFSPVLRQTSLSLKFSLIPVNSPSGSPEFIDVPFVAYFAGFPFADGPSYWNNNCLATDTTNGVDKKTLVGKTKKGVQAKPISEGVSPEQLDLPSPFLPTLPPALGSHGIMKTYILPGNKTGVMFIGTFDSDHLSQFLSDVLGAFAQFKASGVKNILIDVTDNEGGIVCLALYLHQFFAGTKFGLPGFQSTTRANPLAQKIQKAVIAQRLNDYSLYAPDRRRFLNGTQMPPNFNYYDPPLPYVINGKQDPTSQRFTDLCLPISDVPIPADPPFDLKNVVIVGNGVCASTCALFVTLMFERHQTKIVTFGGRPDRPIEYKGMAGNQVLTWTVLDSEIKTAGLKNDPLAPPDLLVSAGMSHNWRTAYSFLNENLPIAYVSEPSKYRFPYTAETFNNPQKLWTFVEKQFFH